jgi:N-acyl-L-homoserine lactone synthetase
MRYQAIDFEEAGYQIRSIEAREDRIKAHRLRHEVFCQMLSWVPPSPDGLEEDRYDSFSTSVGVFDPSGKILALIRFVPPDRPFMMESDFVDLLAPDYEIRKEPDTVEITRLAIAPSYWHQGGSSRLVSMLIYKGMYQWILTNRIHYAYMVIEKRFWRVLRATGFPCVPIGPIRALPPAEVECLAAILDWDEFRVQNRTKRSEFLEWMTKVQSSRVPYRGLSHVLDSKPPALPEYSGRETSPSVR